MGFKWETSIVLYSLFKKFIGMDNSFCELSVSDFKKKITEPDSVLIDIRTKEEWEKYGVIPETDKYIVF
jgi:hypothetical protein